MTAGPTSRHSRSAARTRRSTSVRVRVVLASAVLLGLAPSMTLAAWTDTEFIKTSLETSRFDLQSASATAPTFTSHNTAVAALSLGTPAAFSPGVSRFAAIDFRTSSDSSVGGTVSLSTHSLTMTTGAAIAAADLTYRMAVLPSATTDCTATTIAASTAWVGTAAGAYTNSGAVGTVNPTLPVSAAAASVTRLCVEAKLALEAPSTYQGRKFDLQWVFIGTSAE